MSNWDETKNALLGLNPKKISSGSSKKAYFICPSGEHSNYREVREERRKGYCLTCNSLENLRPDLVNQWSSNNEKRPDEVTAKSNKKAWWKCLEGKDHPDYLQTCNDKVRKHYGCPMCANKVVTTDNSLKDKRPDLLKYWSDNNSQPPERYHEYSNKVVWWKCENTEHPDYEKAIGDITRFHIACPLCNKPSRGERVIEEKLKALGVEYTREYRYPDCINVKPLPFDFRVSVGNEYKLIEYDGKQHTESIEFFGGADALAYIKQNDGIKNSYCLRNNISLLRINTTSREDIHKQVTSFVNNG